MMQHLSLVWRRHSLGVHLSQIQNPICRHLQQQQEQHIRTTNITTVNNALPQVVTDKSDEISFFF